MLWTLVFPAERARSGTLDVYERSVGPGAILTLSPPANQVVLNIDFDPVSAEGGGVYGLSELGIVTTGDLVINAIVSSCQLAGCIMAPESFAGGTALHLTGVDNTMGDFSMTSPVIGISFSGTNGFVVVGNGEYLDATAAGQTIGSVQTIKVVAVASVPEPSSPSALLLGCLTLAALARQRLPSRPLALEPDDHSHRP